MSKDEMNKQAVVDDTTTDLPNVTPPPGRKAGKRQVVIEEDRNDIEETIPSGPLDLSSFTGPIVITLDWTEELVLELDNKGRDLYFAEGKDFKFLPGDVVRQLSKQTKYRYQIAKGSTEGTLHIGESDTKTDVARDILQRFAIPGGTATDKLKIREGDPNMIYSHMNLERYNYAEERGWTAAGEEVKAFSNVKETSSKILKNKKGEPELILMKKPRAVHEEEQRLILQRRMAMRGKLANDDLEAVRAAGGKGFNPEEEEYQGVKWKPI